MDLDALFVFVPACFALNLAPGPNNLLSISNAVHYGFGRSCLGGLGRLLAFALMIGLASMGLAAIILASETLFGVIKLIGALYLLFLAWRLWTSPPAELETTDFKTDSSVLTLMQREFLIAAGNPKAILIFTAFLPQFVTQDESIPRQFLYLGAMFLLLEWVAIALYAYLGTHVQRWLGTHSAKRLFNRGCSALLGCAGIALLIMRQPS